MIWPVVRSDETITVAELKKLLEGIPDDAVLGYDGCSSHSVSITSVEVPVKKPPVPEPGPPPSRIWE